MKTVLTLVAGVLLLVLIAGVSFVVARLVQANYPVVMEAPPHALRLGAAPPGPGISQVTWGASTATIGNQSCILLDGGAATYASDGVPVSGYTGAASGGCFFTCAVPGAAAVEDSFQAQVSNDGVLYGTLASQNVGLLDAGVKDGGVAGFSEIQVTAAAYCRIQLGHLAAQNSAACCTVNTVPR